MLTYLDLNSGFFPFVLVTSHFVLMTVTERHLDYFYIIKTSRIDVYAKKIDV